MKLKRMWPAVCIWVIFIIFDVIMVASSSFFSGLFPSTDNMTYTIAFTVLGTAVMGVLIFLLGKLSDYMDIKAISQTMAAKILYVIVFAALIVGGIFDRLDVLGTTTKAPSGKLSLYENAVVGGTPEYEYDLLSVLFSKLLKMVLIFTGNKQLVAFIFSIALFIIFIITAGIAVRLLLGKAASVVFVAYTAFMPVFSDNLYRASLSTDELFYAMFGISLLLISVFLKISDKEHDNSPFFVIGDILIGAAVGFMTYVDAGVIVVILPLILSCFFLLGSNPVQNIFRCLFVAIGGFCTFFAMILQEGGFSNFGSCLTNWSAYFFKNTNTFNTFWTYTNYKLIYVVTFVAMTGVLVGFWNNRFFERVSPFLLSTVLVFLVEPFFGATRMNDERVLTIYFAIVLGCLASLIVTDKDEGNTAIFAEISDVEEVEKISETEPKVTVVRPEIPTKAFEPKEPEKNKDIAEAKATMQTAETNKVKAAETTKEQAKRDTGHFVPEGMVLPEGAEEEMDVEKSKMKMPKFEGKLSLNRPVKKAEVKKDDFDIAFKPGDDFDI